MRLPRRKERRHHHHHQQQQTLFHVYLSAELPHIFRLPSVAIKDILGNAVHRLDVLPELTSRSDRAAMIAELLDHFSKLANAPVLIVAAAPSTTTGERLVRVLQHRIQATPEQPSPGRVEPARLPLKRLTKYKATPTSCMTSGFVTSMHRCQRQSRTKSHAAKAMGFHSMSSHFIASSRLSFARAQQQKKNNQKKQQRYSLSSSFLFPFFSGLPYTAHHHSQSPSPWPLSRPLRHRTPKSTSAPRRIHPQWVCPRDSTAEIQECCQLRGTVSLVSQAN